MKAALHVLRPGENVAIRVVDFDGDLDALLRPYFDGEDFEHLYVRKGDGLFDMFVAKEAPQGALPNGWATEFYRSTLPAGVDPLPSIAGVAVLIEGIKWDEGLLEPRHYRPDYEGEN
jgi:hypothetical protein